MLFGQREVEGARFLDVFCIGLWARQKGTLLKPPTSFAQHTLLANQTASSVSCAQTSVWPDACMDGRRDLVVREQIGAEAGQKRTRVCL